MHIIIIILDVVQFLSYNYIMMILKILYYYYQ
jgi:hypothetical protein